MSQYPAVDIVLKMLDPSFFEEFVAAINEARDRLFRAQLSEIDGAEEEESSEAELPFDLQEPIVRILSDLSGEVASVWQEQCERLVQRYQPLPPVTAADLSSHLISQLAGVPLDPDNPKEFGEKFLRAALLLQEQFCPAGEWDGVSEVIIAYELFRSTCDGTETFPPRWFGDRVLAEVPIDAPDFLIEEWGVLDDDAVEFHRKISERDRMESEALLAKVDLSKFKFSHKHNPRKDDKQAIRDCPAARWEEIYHERFWKSDSGAAVLLLPVPDESVDYNAGHRRCIVKVMLDGAFTRSALKVAVKRVGPAVETMLRLAMTAAEVGKEPRLWRLHTSGVRELFTTGTDLLLDDQIDGKDELTRRLHNALYLLQTERDVASNRLGLSLSFGAIESLLTKPGGGSTNQLLDHTPALLQPNSAARKKSMKVINDLYDLRSKMVHGRWVTPHPEDGVLREMVRTLSVGVLIGVLEARTNWKRTTGESLPIKELHWQLHVCHEREQSMVGVEDLSAFLPSKLPKTKMK